MENMVHKLFLVMNFVKITKEKKYFKSKELDFY